ncbi:fungal-specific transcription factor domain-containing protein [Whalleya microplaca]|nr:fungal-specific transcription factor domain-containing protein [Whalleya microplaca]
MATTGPSWPGVRPVKTCTECKQSKLRCDSKDRFPNPCTRCHARNLTCTVDPSFRRTPARKRLEAMSKELQELREKRGSSYDARATSTASPGSSSSQDATDSASQPSLTIPVDDFDMMSLETLQLGDVIMSKQSAVEAFKIFTSFYYAQLPILGPVSVGAIYHSHPFLFWTIIAIVASHSSVPSDESLYDRLQVPYGQFLRIEALRAPLPLSKIQALLFLSMWPLPVEHQREDPSWLYCGIAVNSALYMGLHRSNPHSDTTPSLYSVGVMSGSAYERTNTWLGCFYVSTSLSMLLGLPPMINTPSDLTTIRSFLSEQTIPREFTLLLRVLLSVASFTNVLAHDSNDGVVDSSVIQLLDSELDTLKITFPEGWNSLTDFTVMVAKIHVYTLVITRARPGSSSRDILLKLGLAAALRIIHLASLRLHNEQAKPHTLTVAQRHKTLSKDYFRGVAFATIFLLRYFSLNNNATTEEQQLAANHIIMAHTIFKTMSVRPRDEWERVAVVFETLCKQAPLPVDANKLRLTDRMGVSIVLDAISTASELRGKPVEITEHHIPTTDHLAGQINLSQPDIFTSSSQLVEPWPSELSFSNEFWSDPMWDVFSVATGAGSGATQYHPGQGLQ